MDKLNAHIYQVIDSKEFTSTDVSNSLINEAIKHITLLLASEFLKANPEKKAEFIASLTGTFENQKQHWLKVKENNPDFSDEKREALKEGIDNAISNWTKALSAF